MTEDDFTEIQVKDLRIGDVMIFGSGTKRTVNYCVPSSIDPVHLIGFADDKTQIAKSPDDYILIDERR